MLELDTRAKGHGPQVAWGGGGAILAGLLALVQGQLTAFNLDKWPLVAIGAIIVLAGLAIAQFGVWRARRRETRELSEALDAALGCWPPRFASELSPYDVGVRPALRSGEEPWKYMKRDADAALAEALKDSDIVVVFGPAGAGKSRTAFEAIPDKDRAVMLVPEHAEGLATLLRRWPSLRLADDDHLAVLWLDGLERYVSGLDADPIIALLRRRISAGRRSRLPRRQRQQRVKVLATIRDDELEQLLEGDAAEGYPVRRLLACAQGVHLPRALSDAEQERFARRYGAPPAGPSVPEAFGSVWRGGWRSPPASSTPGRRWEPRTWDGGLIVLGVLLVGALTWLYTMRNELTVPPPIETQVAELVGEADCTAEAFPPDGKGLEESGRNSEVLVVIEHGEDCGVSDEVRFYRVRKQRLREVATVAPAPSMARQIFSCLGPAKGSPCHAAVTGRNTFIVGAFEDAQTHQELPVAFSLEDGSLRAWPLALPRAKLPDEVPKSVRGGVNERVALQLRVEQPELGADGGPCTQLTDCRGRPAHATAVVPRSEGRPALLLAGYTLTGTIDAPEELAVRLWHLGVKDGEPTVDRDCVVLSDGLVEDLELDYPEESLHAGWRRDGSQVMC